MRNELIVIFFICISFTSCSQDKGKMQFKVIPLHPYSASPTYYNKNETKKNSYVVKLFFIDGPSKATDKLSENLDSFIIRFLKGDKDFNEYGDCHIYFYKKSSEINKTYRDTGGHNTIDSHEKDLLFEYHWSNKGFKSCDYYENGNVVKTITNKRKF